MPAQRGLLNTADTRKNDCVVDISVKVSSHQGYDEFFDREYVLVVAFLCKAGFPYHLADDATAQAMTLAYEQWSKIDTSPRGWIRTTAYRLAARSTVASRTEVPRLLTKGYGALVDDGTAFYREIEEQDELLQILEQLPVKQRLVVAWHLDGFTDDDIAELTGMRQTTVRSNLRHGRKTLRKIISDESERRVRNEGS